MENLTVFLLPKSGRKYSFTNSCIFAITPILQDDHLTAGTRAAFDGSVKKDRLF